MGMLLAVLGPAGCVEAGTRDTQDDAAVTDDTVPSDTGVTADTGDTVDACGGCAGGKVCCPSRFEGDIPRCVDPTLNPENCGQCGKFCDGACVGSECVAAAACTAGDTCTGGLVCSSQGGQGRCCPAGTTFIMSPADFFGCCPDGDICGCREGNCPISVRAAKTEIRYADSAELAALGRELLATRLATYRYRGATSDRRQLGFIIDDGAPAHGIAGDARHVDLYGYVSLAVAALQTQAREVDGLRSEIASLRARLEALEAGKARR